MNSCRAETGMSRRRPTFRLRRRKAASSYLSWRSLMPRTFPASLIPRRSGVTVPDAGVSMLFLQGSQPCTRAHARPPEPSQVRSFD